VTWRALEAFDQRVDAWIEGGRGRPGLDASARVASFLGDHGLVWFFIGVALARRPGPRRRSALRAVIFTGLVVPLVNTKVKRAVDRSRPEAAVSVPGLRAPTSASFPSGHTTAAWCAATLLAEDDTLGAFYYAVAVTVSASRLQVRHHHASDVAAGMILGRTLGLAGRRLVPLGRRR